MSIFRQKAPVLIDALLEEFPFLQVLDGAAIAGNAGHESGGFTQMQELRPTVKGSRGGLGWFQWTGPRRRAFEAWCKRHGMKPASDAANIGFLVHELRTSEAQAIPRLRAAATLEAKVRAFELAYERAGVKHYASRVNYAKQALAAYQAINGVPLPRPKPVEAKMVMKDEPRLPLGDDRVAEVVDDTRIDAEVEDLDVREPKSLAKSGTMWGAISMAASSGAFVAFDYITSWKGVVLIMFVVTLGFAAYFIHKRMQLRRKQGI